MFDIKHIREQLLKIGTDPGQFTPMQIASVFAASSYINTVVLEDLRTRLYALEQRTEMSFDQLSELSTTIERQAQSKVVELPPEEAEVLLVKSEPEQPPAKEPPKSEDSGKLPGFFGPP